VIVITTRRPHARSASSAPFRHRPAVVTSSSLVRAAHHQLYEPTELAECLAKADPFRKRA